ncbi:MAG: 3-methyl-2-oxobutanoate hydroxymethyltransferase [Tepidisphaeraceae bacterium]
MNGPLLRKFTLADLRRARETGQKVPMLTCYDFTTARLMQDAGVPMLLAGDSAANVILGHATTVPAPLGFMIEITAAVRRGAPLAFVVADMPFGSYGGEVSRGFRSVVRMMKLSSADCVKIEAGPEHAPLVRELAGIGVAVMAHLGLRPQSVGLTGGYRFRGRTAEEARALVDVAIEMQRAGAASILLEAVPPEVSHRIVGRTSVPIIGCGAGPACHGSVVVTHDAVGLSGHKPRFVPEVGDLATPTKHSLAAYVQAVVSGAYPGPQHQYEMPPEEKQEFLASQPEQSSQEIHP